MFEALRQLPPGQRAAVVLRYWNDLSVEEIAGALGCRPGTVKSRLHKARQRLRRILAGPAGATEPSPADGERAVCP